MLEFPVNERKDVTVLNKWHRVILVISFLIFCLPGMESLFANANVFIIFTTLPTDGEIAGLVILTLQKEQRLLCFYILLLF